MDDRITEVREALADYERMWVLVDEAPLFDTLATAAQEWLALLDSDALIIRRDEDDKLVELIATTGMDFIGDMDDQGEWWWACAGAILDALASSLKVGSDD